MKARIPSHREFIINFPDSVDQAKANEGWAKLQQVVEDTTALPSTLPPSSRTASLPSRSCRKSTASSTLSST